MTSSSSAQKDKKKYFFSSFSKSFKKSSACCCCVFFVQAPTEPSLAQSLLPSPVFLFHSFPAGRPRSHFQQSISFWVVCSPQHFLFHPLSFSLWSPDSPWPPSLPLLPFPSLPCHLSYSCCFCGFRHKHPLSQWDIQVPLLLLILWAKCHLPFLHFLIFILILSARRLYL